MCTLGMHEGMQPALLVHAWLDPRGCYFVDAVVLGVHSSDGNCYSICPHGDYRVDAV
jgi:hypothetical protein